MSIQNIGTNRWRVTTKTGTDSKTGVATYFNSTIKGTRQDAKDLETTHTLFDRRKLSVSFGAVEF